jgi:hypothetical protein
MTLTPQQVQAADEKGDRIYRELKVLAERLVRHIKDEAHDDAVLMLTSHLLDVRVQAQEEVYAVQDKVLAGLKESQA